MPKHITLVPQPKLDLPDGDDSDWFLSPAEILAKKTDFVREHSALVEAKAAQATAAEKLAVARLALGLAVARLGALPDVVRDEHVFAASQRAHRQRLADLAYLTETLRAQAVMLDAKHKRDALLPKSAPAAPPSPPRAGLTPDELNDLLTAVNEVSPDLRTTLHGIFTAALDEKKKR